MITEATKGYIKNIIKDGKRADNRKLDEFRNIKIKKGVAENAEGSAQIQMGNTVVIVGVKMETGEPFPDTPNEGKLMVNAELDPLASPDFELGPPDEKSVELARVVDRGIRESETIDMEKLCIEEGEKVWTVSIDIFVINDDGNLIDASGLATVAALKDAKIPKITEEGEIDRDEFDGKLPIKAEPVPCTYYKIDNNIILDPDIEEESVVDARMTMFMMKDSRFCASQKGGEGGFTEKEVINILNTTEKNTKKLRKYLK